MTYEELAKTLTETLDALHTMQELEKKSAKKEYCVGVDVTYSTHYYVEASSEEEAEKLAELEAEDTNGPGAWVSGKAHFVEEVE